MKYRKYLFISIISICILTMSPFYIANAESSTGPFFDFFSKLFINNTNTQTSATADAKVLAPIRLLKLDTLGKNLFFTGDDLEDHDGILTELSSNGTKLKEWKVKYEQKGHARHICEPPMLNISFDKTTSKGKAKELFTGLSTYAGYTQLQYQKIRLIPDCDMWNDYWLGGGETGLGGQLNVLLREYTIHKIFRMYGVPTADIIGFTNITFDSSDPKYKGKVFKYMIVQRPQEKDDQIPFTTQFNFKPDLYQSGNNVPWSISMNESESQIKTEEILLNRDTEEKRKVTFDKESQLRFMLLTDFTNLSDTGFLHNEDGGVDIKSGEIKSIPHGFDASFGCLYQDMQYMPSGIDNAIQNLPEGSRQEYRNIYYKIAKEIFGSKDGLDKILNTVNAFPYDDVDKYLLTTYIKVRFHEFATYFNSEDFSNNMQQKYNSKDKYLPYTESEFMIQKNILINKCHIEKTDLKGVTISVIEKPIITIREMLLVAPKIKAFENQIPDKQHAVANVNMEIEIKTSNSELKIFKEGVISSSFLGEKNNLVGNSNANYYMSGIEDSIGPYHVIPPNTKARMHIYASYLDDTLLKDSYYFKLESIEVNNKYNPIPLNIKSNVIDFGILTPVKINSPKQDEILNVDSKYDITWTAGNGRRVAMEVVDKNGMNYQIDKNYSDIYPGNKYTWNVGQIYYYDRRMDDIKTKFLDSGSYRIRIYDGEVNRIDDVVNNIKIVNTKKPRIIGMTSPQSGQVFEKGERMEIVWNTSNISDSDDIKIDLMGHNNTKLISNIDIVKNQNNTYWWRIPNDLDLDFEDLYVIRVTDITGRELATKSGRFNIIEKSEPKIEIISNIMKLKYDKNNKESGLQVSTSVVITAPQDRDTFIPSLYAFNVFALNENKQPIYGMNTYTSDIPSSLKGYNIKAGTSANFRIITNLENLNKAFPGIYKAVLFGFDYGKDYDKYARVPDNFSNPVTIIGETSPYIENIDFNAVTKNITLTGVRYGSAMMDLTVADYDLVYTSKVMPANVNGKNVITFNLKDFNFPADQDFVIIQLTNTTEGQSNLEYLRLK